MWHSHSWLCGLSPIYTTNPPTNQYSSIGGSGATYDLNGNVTNDFLHTYALDANGRPVTIDTVGVTYDALGRMVEQNRSSSYTQIVYAPSGAKLALMTGTTLQKGYVPLTGGTMAVYNSSGLAYYRHSDWVGSSRFASTSTRTLYFDGAYAPFGEPYATTGTTDLSYTGMNQDTVSNLYDFPQREYGIQGRWPATDPAGTAAVDPRNPQTWNRYAYALNNPLGFVDPTGTTPEGPTGPSLCLAPPIPTGQCTATQDPPSKLPNGFNACDDERPKEELQWWVNCSGDKNCCINKVHSYQPDCTGGLKIKKFHYIEENTNTYVTGFCCKKSQ